MKKIEDFIEGSETYIGKQLYDLTDDGVYKSYPIIGAFVLIGLCLSIVSLFINIIKKYKKE